MSELDNSGGGSFSSCSGCSNVELRKQVDDIQASLDGILASRAEASRQKQAEKQAEEAEAVEWLRRERSTASGEAIGRVPLVVGAVAKSAPCAPIVSKYYQGGVGGGGGSGGEEDGKEAHDEL